ncbi:MAG: ATP-binding protein [Thermomicrobiales bacterium]
MRTARAMAPDRTIELDVTGSPVAIADADQIEQVLLILLDNAVRHSQAPELVQVSVAPKFRPARELPLLTKAKVHAPEHLPHLFDRFYRVDTSRSRQAGGSGLGLSIAQAIVERFDGEIAVASEPGVGTTFTIVLPDVSPHESARRQVPRDTSQ